MGIKENPLQSMGIKENPPQRMGIKKNPPLRGVKNKKTENKFNINNLNIPIRNLYPSGGH
jgi:hypothetical protein